MQFSIIAVLAFALSAVATPIIVERNETPGQQVQDQCGNTKTAACCDQLQQEILNLIPVEIGVNCVALNLISVGPVAQQCGSNSVVACCNTDGTQTGVINVGTVCAPVQA